MQKFVLRVQPTQAMHNLLGSIINLNEPKNGFAYRKRICL